MEIKIVAGTVAGGQQRKIGDVVDVPDSEAVMLIRLKRAVPVEKAPVETATDEVRETATQPTPRKRTRSRRKKSSE